MNSSKFLVLSLLSHLARIILYNDRFGLELRTRNNPSSNGTATEQIQWFVQQGIEVWSTKEGEQRFDNHVDKLLNYIRFWQASGESEKTSIRVKTKHIQMVQDGQYRGGHIPFGYKLEHQGRTNKKNQPVRDLVIDQNEAVIVKQIFDLLTTVGMGQTGWRST